MKNAAFGGTAQVEATTNSRPTTDQLEVMVWTSAPALDPLDLSTANLVVYSSVRMGGKGVVGLVVTATLYNLEGGTQPVPVTLRDDGLGGECRCCRFHL